MILGAKNMTTISSKYDVTSEKLNDIWMLGFAEEEYGSCQEEGFASALIVPDNLFGIIEENSLGFVDYEIFKTEQDARNRWSDMVTTWEQHYHPEAIYA